jgi:hypothetical protein
MAARRRAAAEVSWEDVAERHVTPLQKRRPEFYAQTTRSSRTDRLSHHWIDPPRAGRASPAGLTAPAQSWHLIHMRRTNLVLSEDLLEETLRVSGERTYSRAVERAMEDFIRRARARRILELAGSGLWEGNLSEVREDRPEYKPDRRSRRGTR